MVATDRAAGRDRAAELPPSHRPFRSAQHSRRPMNCATDRQSGGSDRLEPRDHRERDAVALCDRRQPRAGITALDRLSALIVAKLALPTEPDAVGHGPLAAFTSAFSDQIT